MTTSQMFSYRNSASHRMSYSCEVLQILFPITYRHTAITEQSPGFRDGLFGTPSLRGLMNMHSPMSRRSEAPDENRQSSAFITIKVTKIIDSSELFPNYLVDS